jgi:DUF2971 family protein
MFKYMSIEVAPLFASTCKVRFTQPFDLNDPFEFRPFIDFQRTTDEFRGLVDARVSETFSTVDGALAMAEKQLAMDPNSSMASVLIPAFRQMIVANPALEQQIMAKMKPFIEEVLDLVINAVQWETLWEKFQQMLGDTVGIFSLTEDPAHILMWSHYASQHRGIVVELDENHPWFHQKKTPADDLRHLVQVSYVQNPHPRTWNDLDGIVLLYTKTAEWAYEREWRIIRPLKEGMEVSPGKFCFDVPPDAVRSIIFGCRMTPALEQQIRISIAQNPQLGHICFKRAKQADSGRIEIVNASAETAAR